jgi:bacillithiol biosynthesis cysteine-adding enzyme BshC
MFKTSTIDFKNSGVLNNLVSDYLNRNEKLKPFYNFFPDKEGFSALLKTDPYATFDRDLLREIVLRQGETVNNTSDASITSIHKLAQKNAFTVTTGHQLCLFTGPLYFIYKIISTINLAEKLRKEFPKNDFVPVYWMASEDHDFEEVSNFHSSGKTLKWESGQTGAVGDFKTEELKKLLPELQNIFGRSENADHLISLFERAYLKHNTLADATRYLVNELFGEYGLVIVDGNDKKFKHQFKEYFKKDIFENSPAELVGDNVRKLEQLGYQAQVNPRPINCFYIEAGLRTRIEKAGDVYNLVGTKTSFTKKELETIIETSPEKVSPNVLLRPLYQQCILPNLAYIGGPGELAYWLEFKKMFDASKTVFPILIPRNFVTVIEKSSLSKIAKLNFSEQDIFKPEQELIKELLAKTGSVFGTEQENKVLSAFYADLLGKTKSIDATLEGSVSAELKRTLNGMERITRKANKALRRKSETSINQIKSVKHQLFPNNVPQERYENFSSFYLSYGKTFFSELKDKTDPFLLKQFVFTEE